MILIEQAKESDLNQISLLYDNLNDYLEQNINHAGWKKGIYPTKETAINGLKSNCLYIAKSHNTIVGSIILNHIPEHGYDSVNWLIECDYKDVIVIHTLVVNPSYLKDGIGKKLLDFTVQTAINQNIKSIRLDVYEHNIPAIKLYEKCGFKYIDTIDLGLSSFGLDWFKVYEKLL